MKTKHGFIFVLLAIIALITNAVVYAAPVQKGHMKLLAVSDTDNGYKGITADLYLEVQPVCGQ